ncbi:pectinesterase 3-like [Cucurbita pepo subsp. pepo]|uniref:pectinesterase 3-like n=1 Tax=Cucurbita pepo subsp. pepo TaxID=3664 RepID=UPI000C9D77BA|nr:pectinesterase 3-like [Cucurbita pepo subsp. pepo]XP_023520180.1 pectinesterase 3-like [Cucurbita pepo subsp. pepo]
MDQINALKGYGKVTHLELQLEDQLPPPSKPNFKIPNHKSLRLTIAISALVLTTLLIGLIIAASIYNSTGKKSPNSADAINIVCNVTRYPNSCFTSIISLNSSPEPDPELILKLSLQVSLNELSNLSRSLKTLTANGGGEALKDCESQIEDAISLVNDSTAEMESGAGEKTLTESKIGNIQTWMSSAMTDQQSCLDGLEEMDSTSFREVKTRMRKSNEYVSNCLAIVANIHVILEKFEMPLH